MWGWIGVSAMGATVDTVAVENGRPAFERVDGNLDAMSGRYVLSPRADGGTDVTHEAWVDLGSWMPEFLVEWATRRVPPGVLGGLESATA